MLKQLKGRWLALLAVAALGAGIWLLRGGDDENRGPPPVQVRAAAAERRDVPLEVHEAGTVMAYETVAIRSRIDSQVMEVKFRDGDRVRAGDLLFVLDDRALQARLGELEANLRRDRAQMENFRRQYERERMLTKKGFGTRENLDNARAAFEAQKAAAGATEAALESARVQLGYTRIMSPIDGRTGTISVTAGNTVKANDAAPLVTVNRMQPIRVQAALSQSYLGALRAAMAQGPVAVAAQWEGSGGEASPGTLEYIDNAVDQATGTFALRAVFENPDERLWPGMFVTINLKLGVEKRALTIPEAAVQQGQEGEYVFAVAGGTASRRAVTVARIQDGIAIVGDGLKDGDLVAVDGLMSLKDGSAVTLSGEEDEDKNNNKAAVP